MLIPPPPPLPPDWRRRPAAAVGEDDVARVDDDRRLRAEVRRVALRVEPHEPAEAVGVLRAEHLDLADRREGAEGVAHLRRARVDRHVRRLLPVEVEGEAAAERRDERLRRVDQDELLGEGEVGRRLAARHDARLAGLQPDDVRDVHRDRRHRPQVERVRHQRAVVEVDVEGQDDGGLVDLDAAEDAHLRDHRERLERVLHLRRRVGDGRAVVDARRERDEGREVERARLRGLAVEDEREAARERPALVGGGAGGRRRGGRHRRRRGRRRRRRRRRRGRRRSTGGGATGGANGGDGGGGTGGPRAAPTAAPPAAAATGGDARRRGRRRRRRRAGGGGSGAADGGGDGGGGDGDGAAGSGGGGGGVGGSGGGGG